MHTLAHLVDTARCAAWHTEARSSLRCRAVADARADGLDGEAPWRNGLRLIDLPELHADVLDTLLGHARLREHLARRLGRRVALLADHGWLRHQRPPPRRAPGQTPHSWHQDGALGFDFIAGHRPYPADALLNMLTCWVPLVDCGRDAPGLAWFEPEPRALLAPVELVPTEIRASLAPLGPGLREEFAVLAAGDALLFGGGVVHRTHATEDMVHDRISVELRWLPADAVPARLAGGRVDVIDLRPQGNPPSRDQPGAEARDVPR